jgi:hypothetical protein
MIQLSERTREHLTQLFAREHRVNATQLLEEFCAESLSFGEPGSPESLERVRFAALKLSDGNVDALCRAIDLATMDWRDLLVAAEFADDPDAHRKWSPEAKWQADGGSSRSD